MPFESCRTISFPLRPQSRSNRNYFPRQIEQNRNVIFLKPSARAFLSLPPLVAEPRSLGDANLRNRLSTPGCPDKSQRRGERIEDDEASPDIVSQIIYPSAYTRNQVECPLASKPNFIGGVPYFLGQAVASRVSRFREEERSRSEPSRKFRGRKQPCDPPCPSVSPCCSTRLVTKFPGNSTNSCRIAPPERVSSL